MHILIIGASGRTGKLVTAESLKQGHTVSVLVRKASAFEPTTGLSISTGTPEKQEDIRAAFQNAPVRVDAVISTLAAPRASDSPFAKPLVAPYFMRDCTTNLVEVMREFGTRKLVVLSSFGVGDSAPNTPWVLNMLFRHTNMAVQFQDHDAVDEYVRKQDLQWTLVRPMRLTEVDNTTLRVLDGKTKEVGMFSSCARKDVALQLVKSAEKADWERKAIVIANN